MGLNLSLSNFEEVVQGIVSAVTVNPIAGSINIIKGVADIFGWEQETTTQAKVATELPAAAAIATPTEKEQLLQLALQLQTQQAALDQNILNQG